MADALQKFRHEKDLKENGPKLLISDQKKLYVSISQDLLDRSGKDGRRWMDTTITRD